MKSAVIANFASVAGVREEDISILKVDYDEADGLPSILMVYAGQMFNLPIVFANSIVGQESRTIQVATFATGSELTETHRQLHEEFLSEVRFDP